MNYSNIIKHDCANGEGWRTTLFVSGCNFHCPGCFNQEAQDFNYGKLFDQDAELYLRNCLEDPLVTGLSILGGEPLHQDASDLFTLARLAVHAHKLGKNVWLWTGCKWEDIFTGDFDAISIYQQVLLSNCDVVVDGQFIESQKDLSLEFRGSKNQRIIDVNKTLEQNKIVLWEQT